MTEFTERHLRRIAARAELLHERIDNGHTGEVGDPNEYEVAERFRTLYRESEHGDLEQRLRVLGVELTELVDYAAFESWPEDEPLPDWVSKLDMMVSEILGSTAEAVPAEQNGIPFVHLLKPFTSYALSSPDVEVVRNDDFWQETALADAETWLLRRLSTVVAQPLQVEFRLFKQEFTASEPESTAAEGHETELYDAFIDELLDGELVTVIRRYPLLGRNLVVVIQQWTRFLTTLASRFRRDYDDIESRFAAGSLGTVERLNIGRGDLHDRGNAVTEIVFRTDKHVYYKPRPVDSDILFKELIEKLLADERCSLMLTTPNFIARDGYGWSEKIERAGIGSESPAEYYRRIGGVLGLYYVFNGSDLHFENIIANGANPVVIDSETLLTRSKIHDALPDTKADQQLAKYELEDSVYRTGLLPVEISAEAVVPEVGDSPMDGLTRIEEFETERQRPDWRNVNTDQMTFRVSPVVFSPTSNYPERDGTPILPTDYRESIVAGFEEVYEALQRRNPKPLLDDLSVSLDSLETRYLFRNTESYFAARFQLQTPRCQKNGVEAGLKLERLVPEIQIADEPNQRTMEKLLVGERTSLYDGNVPRFGIVGTDVLFRGDSLVEGFFDRTHRELAEERLAGLSEADRERQCGYIAAALSARTDGKAIDEDPTDGGNHL